MPLSGKTLCKLGLHEWDAKPLIALKSFCVRKTCRHVFPGFGRRKGSPPVGRRKHRAASSSPPLSPPAAPDISLPVEPSPTSSPSPPSSADWSRVAERLKAHGWQGAMPAAPAQATSAPTSDQAPSTVGSSSTPPTGGSPERASLTDWFLPEIPGMVTEGCGYVVRWFGREPGDPDELWQERWGQEFDKGVRHHLPRLRMPWWVALLVATICICVSMWIGGTPIDEKKAQRKPVTPPAPPPPEAPRAPSPPPSTSSAEPPPPDASPPESRSPSNVLPLHPESEVDSDEPRHTYEDDGPGEPP
jgi:hypothetical protein